MYVPLILVTSLFLINNIRIYGFVEGFLPWLPILSFIPIFRELYFPEYRRPFMFLGMFILFYIIKCPKWLQTRILASYTTSFPIELKNTQKSIYLLSPHGATTFAATRLSANIQVATGRCAKIVLAPMIKYVPFSNMIVRLVCDPVWADPKSVHNALKSSTSDIILYPGGLKEVFLNAFKNAPISNINMGPRSVKWLNESPLRKVNVRVLGESSVYYQPKWLVIVFQILNRYIQVGLPIPTFLPFGKDPNTIHMYFKYT